MPERSGVGVLTTDRDLVVRTWNPWLAAVTGLSEARACGRALDQLSRDSGAGWDRALFAEILETGTARVFAPAFHRYLIRCAPQQAARYFDYMQQHVTVAPLREGGAVVGLMVTIEDVTSRLDDERALAAELAQHDTRDVALDAVGSADWRLRRRAVASLHRTARQDDIAYLIQTVQRDHQNLNVLSSALQVLVASDVDVVPPLLGLLRDPDANLRMHAALALGELRADAAVQPLIAVLADPDHNVRFHAIEALGRIGPADAVDPLAAIAASGDFFLAFAAIDALARTDDPRVAPHLVQLLAQPDLRPAVIDTLAALGDEDCVEALTALLDDADPAAVAIANALVRIHARYEQSSGAGAHIEDLVAGRITPAAVARLAQALGDAAADAAVVEVLGWAGAAALGALVTALGSGAAQQAVDAALLRIGAPAVEPLLQRLDAGTRQERLASAALLGRLGDRRAVTPLLALLRSADSDLVCTAAGALATLGDPRALEHLLPLFADEHASVRQAAIAAVNSIGSVATASRIQPRLTDADPRVREAAIRVAGYFGFDACVDAILAAVGDEHEDVRRAALEQLPVIDDDRAVSKLVRALKEETPRNRAAAAHALRAVDDPLAAAPLRHAMDDASPWVRYFAANSLAQRHVPEALPALVRCAASDPAPHVRIAALQALGAQRARAIVDVAAGLLDDPDQDLVAAALSALGGVDDPRVDELLDRAIRGPRETSRVPAALALAARGTRGAVDALAWAVHLDAPRELPGVAIDSLRQNATAADPSVRAAAVQALIELGTDAGLRQRAVAALARIPDVAIPAAASLLNGAPRSARLLAVDALARMRHRQASAALAQALDDGDAGVRAAAVAAFGRLGTPTVRDAVMRLAASDPDSGVRRRAEAVCRRHRWGGWPS